MSKCVRKAVYWFSVLSFCVVAMARPASVGDWVWGPQRNEHPFESGLLDDKPQEEQGQSPSPIVPLTILDILGPGAVYAAMTNCPSGTPTAYLLWCLRTSGTFYTRSEYHEVITLIDLMKQLIDQGRPVSAKGNITGAVPIDWNDGTTQTGTLIGNVTLGTPTNPVNGRTYTLILTQDATGGRTVTWPSVISWVNDNTAPAMPITANRSALFTLTFNGTDYVGTNPRPFTDTDTDAQTMQSTYNFGKQILFAGTGSSNGVVMGVDGNANGNCDGTGGDQCQTCFVDGALGFTCVTSPDAPTRINSPAGFDTIFRIGGTQFMFLNNVTKKLDFSNAGQPLKSVEVQGREFGVCTYAEAILAASKPVIGAFTCTDVDTDGFDFDFMTPLSWNAGTVTVRLTAASVNATPSGNIVLSCSGQAVSDGDVIANRAITGEQTVTLGLATQNNEEQATSAAITITGTPVAGDHLYMHCDIDAAGTTATMANVRINAMAKVFYTVTSTSE